LHLLHAHSLTHIHSFSVAAFVFSLTLCIILPLPVRSSPPSSPSIHIRGSPLAYIHTHPTCTLTQLAAGCTPGQSDATLHAALSSCCELASRRRGGLAGQRAAPRRPRSCAPSRLAK
jgi:hypothetical protein